jgi:hypothetical protein
MRRAGALCLLATLVALALLLSAAPAGAADGVTFAASEARPQFPERIDFRVDVTGAASDIADVRLYYGHIQNPVRTMVRPTFVAGRQVEATFSLNTRERYLPPGSEIEYYWSARDAAGGRFESPRQRFTLLDARYQWKSSVAGLVTLHWHAGDDAFAKDVLDTAQRTLDRLKQQVGVEPTQPISIIFYGSNAEFAQALPPNSAEWIGGQAYPALNLIIAGVRPDGGAAREVRRMIPHELSHIVLHQATDNPYNTPPTWLDEGLAVFNQETPDGRFPGLIRDAARSGKLIPLRALNSSFALDPSEALLSYAQSASVVEFVLKQYGTTRAAALVSVFREGVAYDEAVQRSLGVTLEELDVQWRASLGQGVAGGSTEGKGSPTDAGGAETAGSPADAGGLPLASLLAEAAAPLLALLFVVGFFAVRERWRDRHERWL